MQVNPRLLEAFIIAAFPNGVDRRRGVPLDYLATCPNVRGVEGGPEVEAALNRLIAWGVVEVVTEPRLCPACGQIRPNEPRRFYRLAASKLWSGPWGV